MIERNNIDWVRMDFVMKYRKKYFIKTLYMILLVLTSLLIFSACDEKKEKVVDVESVQDFNSEDYTIGVASGFIFEEEVKENLPNANVKIYANREDAYKGLMAGEIDGIADDEPVVRSRLRNDDAIKLVPGYVKKADYSFIFQKSENGEKLSGEFSDYVSELRSNGELDSLDDKWFGEETDNKISDDASSLPNTNGKLKVAYDSEIPFAYSSGGKPTGYEIDIIIGFCEKYGYALELVNDSFVNLFSGVSSGEYDAACNGITITESRKESFYFGAPDYNGGTCIYVKAVVDGAEELQKSDTISNSFKNTFVNNGRYKLFLKGILITIIIVLSALVGGIILGIIMYMYGKRGYPLVRLIIRIITGLIHCIPVVMIVMLVYYSFYNHMAVGGMLASQIAFILYFADEIYMMIERHAIKRKDDEEDKYNLQDKYRLEFIDTKEFFHILFRDKEEIVEDFRERVVTLIKMTAVVGYVTTQDMTRIFDVIRLESKETMIPLVATTIAYFLLIAVVIAIINRINIRSKKDENRGI